MTDTVAIKRKDRRVEHAEDHLRDLPKVPESLFGRVICAHPEIITALCALGMCATFLLPHEMLTLSSAVGVLGFAWGWSDLLRLPNRRGSQILLLIVGMLAVGLGRALGDFSVVTQVVGLGVIAAFLTEMLRRNRGSLIQSVSGNLAGVFVVSTAGAWVVLETQDPWYFLLLPGAVTLLGGCAGMSLSANWPIRWRAVSSIAGATLFGLLAGGATVLLQGPAHEKVLTLLGGHLPSLGVALFCGAGLGVVLGTTFAVLNIVFSAKMVPMSIAAALSQGLVPVLAAAVPIYVLGRLIVGQGPSMNLAALF